MTVSAVTYDHRLTPHVRVHHALPGRTRLRLDPLRGRRDLLGALARRIATREGIIDVRESAPTGALLIEHNRRLPAEAIAAIVRAVWRKGLSAPVAPAPADARAKPWHALDAKSVAAAFASAEGLSEDEAQRRLWRIGENRLLEPEPPSPLVRLVGQFRSAPVALLAGSAVLSLATGGLVEAGLTLAVIALNAGIGASNESWTANLVRRLARQTDPDAMVLRDGVRKSAPTSRVAPGDWIVLETGAAVPADARLIQSEALLIDESSLTGESFPTEKSADAPIEESAPISARRTMVHRGGVVTHGSGLAVVVATGEATEIGRVRSLLHTAERPKPPMEQTLDRLGARLTLLCLGASSALALILLARGAPLSKVAKSAVALAVSAIPEGLPALATTTKAVAARAMAREGAFVRNVNVLETAANLNVVCFDKTGTLTQNRMQASVIETLEARWDRFGAERPPADVRLVAQILALCNDATLAAPDAPSAGSGTELALMHLAKDLGVNIKALTRSWPRVGALLRSEQRLYMATAHQCGQSSLVAVKGAPQQVLELCAVTRDGKSARALTAHDRTRILERNEALARDGLRVLGVARKRGADLGEGLPEALEWLGLVGLRDPLRRGAKQMIATLQGAGLRTIILTGDQAGTARKLAEDLGMSSDGSLDVVDAPALRPLSPEALRDIVRSTEVFARVSPSDKLSIIRALQADQNVVAMTGDGVNDGPALRAADLGLAMGRSGADVARDVADIVIAEDELSALARALARGRAADDNLRRATRFLLATNASEVALLLAESLQGPEAMETPAQLFWLNLMTDVFPALGLSMARPAQDILMRPPRAGGEDVFGRAELRSIAIDAVRMAIPAFITHSFAAARHGSGARTRGLTFLSLASHQLAHALRLRPGRPLSDVFDRSVELGVLAGYALLAVPFVLAPLRRTLRIAAPSMTETGMIVGLSLAPFAGAVLARRRSARQA